MPDVLIGVDGGGTRTRVLLTDFDGNELARGDGPPTLVDPERPEESAILLDAVVRRTMDDARVPRPVAAMWAGLAGAGRERIRERLRATLDEISRDLLTALEVGTDVDAALFDAFGDGPGIALIAGTGSIVLVNAPDGRRITVGGWGIHLGDEGSGYALAREALRHVLWAHDGRGPETALAELLTDLGLDDPEALIDWAAKAKKREVAVLAPRVVEIADRGDAVARALKAEAVAQLRHLLASALRRLGDDRQQLREVALVGGLVTPGRPLRADLEAMVEEMGLTVVTRDVVPERGAARLARRLVP